ncbi:hypothetical protein GCM10010124_11260 [Pilimelia terevasa]|uniref:Uncharacterized protein n=1 Tax=Pilimelia terevasa TaxID=53372 RepID=A0A8J3BK20_9ACTN|nr:hypothetical protein [Pilimelia terevasa]GGK20402.1 hypothetical protein GCM10010124_11260 [Pilimelia terevasa]
MDALDIVLDPARPLLARVDDVLRGQGIPGGHAVQGLLRELGALPGAAVDSVAALRPGPLVLAQRQLAPLAEAYAQAAQVAARPVAWSGAAAQSYAHRAGALQSRLHGDGGARRLADTIRYAEALATWMVTARTGVARALGRVLGSAEAVALTGEVRPDQGLARAAADLAAEVLSAVVAATDDAQRLAATWDERIAYAPFFRPLGAGPASVADALRIG